ncbi:methyl-accepting chemotaxis protein [Desulfuromonas versatilis]|uniref:Methyl-accepting chemotaxis protein n=1 Tax=Desulfuromonas versatilis TaxID=2802975 RepID=A0ABM8HVC2_9BACT|nr:HAMP domain-containing methyl-accepting chemotaxis protein [Desulfuromonas versatilis]BCR06865.1 methyl-accepting chemotaxis protein [Desulfuromonas versatilis]
MRVEISNKFIMGFIIVVGSIVLVNLVVPYLGIPQEWQQLFSVGCAILVGLALGWGFSRAFTANIRVLTESAERLRQGDLSQPVQLRSTALPDETLDLANSLNQVVESLRELVGKIRSSSIRVAESAQGLSSTSEEMTASANEVANTVEQISRGAETQAEMIERCSRLIKEMAVSIELIASSAKKVAASANDTAGTAQRGGEMVGTAIGKMKQVLADVERNGAQMGSFGMQVQKIGKIVEVITGIAGKTNLLALNATIEAARAGEYGRGFAVVAEEIRKLADSTGQSAGEITELIEAIRDEGQKVQASMSESIREIGAGRDAINTTGQAFEEIIQTALVTQTKATGIAELAEKQTEGSAGMVKAIDEISRVVADNAAATEEVSATTQQQSAAMEEMAHAAQGLSTLAEDLLEVVRRFELGNA